MNRNHTIDGNAFRGEYNFLSNFYPVWVEYDGMGYPSVENAYQAAKRRDPKDRVPYQTCTPAQAKRLSRRNKNDYPLWNLLKQQVMLDLLIQKFDEGTELADRLIATGDEVLEEMNAWGDTYWGINSEGEGDNHLGVLLMAVRSYLNKTL